MVPIGALERSGPCPFVTARHRLSRSLVSVFGADGDRVNASSGWATQQLAEFLAVLTAAPDDLAAVDNGLACLAYSFAADACALMRHDRVTAWRGWTGRPHGA